MNIRYRITCVLSWLKLAWHKLINRGRIIICGRHNIIKKNVDIRCEKDSEILIGDGLKVETNVKIHACGGRINLAGNNFVNNNCLIVAKNSIDIGKNTTIGPNVCIYDHDHAPGRRSDRAFICNPVKIGEDVWIGAGAIILKGVTIGNHSIVAAGTIVTHNVPENTLVRNEISYKSKRLEELHYE